MKDDKNIKTGQQKQVVFAEYKQKYYLFLSHWNSHEMLNECAESSLMKNSILRSEESTLFQKENINKLEIKEFYHQFKKNKEKQKKGKPIKSRLLVNKKQVILKGASGDISKMEGNKQSQAVQVFKHASMKSKQAQESQFNEQLQQLFSIYKTDQLHFEKEGNEDTHEYMKATRFSQLGDEQAAKLYEDRFRQIQSDMMKKLQLKKSHQKKLMANPRSSSSLGTYGAQQQQQQQTFLQGQSQLQVNSNGQLSTKNQIQKSQILSKFQGAAAQHVGYMHQSTTLNGGSRLTTEENGQDIPPFSNNNSNNNNNNSKPKHKIKTQRSCEFIIYNQNQSPSHALSVDDNNEVIYLNQEFPSSSANNNIQKFHYLKQGIKAETGNGNSNTDKSSYQRQNKLNNQTVSGTSSASQPMFVSPQSKRSAQQQKAVAAANNTQQTINWLEVSPSGRSTTAMTSQGFYSPQANHKTTVQKFTNGSSTVTNRRNQIENDVKRLSERKKFVDSPAVAQNAMQQNKYLNGSTTTTTNATGITINNPNGSHIQSNYNPANTNSYLIQSSNLKQSVGFQGVNSTQGIPSGQTSIQIQTQNKNNNNNNNNKKKRDSTNIINKLNEIDELDLRIQTIEKEIERDNEIAGMQQGNQYKKQSMTISNPNMALTSPTMNNPSTTKSSYKSNKLYANSPSHHVSTDHGVISTQSQSGTNRHSTYEKYEKGFSTTMHKQSQPMLNIYSPKQVYLSTDSAQQRKTQLYTSDTAETIPPTANPAKNVYGQSTKNMQKIQYDFSKLQVPSQQENQVPSYENSSFNNTPRSVNPIHDFRPFSKQYKKQVNFKSDNRMNTQNSQEERIGKFAPSSPTYSKNNTISSPLNSSVPVMLGGITQNELNLKTQLNNQIQQQISQSRRGQQTSSNPPTMTRIQNNNAIVQFNVTQQGSTSSLKFQKKLISGLQQQQQQQYSQNSNSNLQFNYSQEGTEEDDPEMSEFEYFEKIVNAKNTETSSVGDDSSIQNDPLYNNQGNPKNNNNKFQKQQINFQPKKHSSVMVQHSNGNNQQKSKGRQNGPVKAIAIKGQQSGRNQPNSNRESTNIQPSISVDSSSLQPFLSSVPKQNKAGSTYLPMRQSDCTPQINTFQHRNNNNNNNDSPQISAFQPMLTSNQKQQNLQLKTLENNFVNNTKENGDQYSKHSNSTNINNVSQQSSTSPPMYNLYNQNNQAIQTPSTKKSSTTNHLQTDKQIQQKMNRSSEIISRNSDNNSNNNNNNNYNPNYNNNNNNNNNSNISSMHNGTNNNMAQTPSASSNNISTLSLGMNPQIQVSGSTSSLNKGTQLQMSNKQKNNNHHITMTHTLDTFKNKADFKIKQTEHLPKSTNQDPVTFARTDPPKKSSMKQARFEDEKEEHQLEQMSKNLHRKLNLLLETANQCNENIKSYRINQNN